MIGLGPSWRSNQSVCHRWKRDCSVKCRYASWGRTCHAQINNHEIDQETFPKLRVICCEHLRHQWACVFPAIYFASDYVVYIVHHLVSQPFIKSELPADLQVSLFAWYLLSQIISQFTAGTVPSLFLPEIFHLHRQRFGFFVQMLSHVGAAIFSW